MLILHTANIALVPLHGLFSTLTVYIAPTSHQLGRLPHTYSNKQKMHEQTRRPFIFFSFSTTFPRLLVNQSIDTILPGAYEPP